MALLTNINGKFSVSDAGAVTFNNAFTFPTADGAANYVLQTNGLGQLAWALNGNGDISGSGTANAVTKFTGAKTIGNGPITFSGNNSTFAGNVILGGGYLQLDTNDNSRISGDSDSIDFILWDNNSSYETRMVIKDTGNVGIGTTSPQTTLQVNGAASALNAHFGQGTNNSSGVFGGISLGYSESANASYRKVGIVAKAIGDGAARQELHFLVNSNADSNSAGIADTKMMIREGGNVGIGTTAPLSKLTVSEGTNQHGIELAPGTLSYLQCYDRATNTYGNMTIDAKYLAFGLNNGAEKIRFTADGYVGIGTTTPARPLHVSGVGVVARFQGSQTGYTQGSIVLHSGTADSPSARGQGTYRYNEGSDICWYTGTAYSDTNKYIWARRTGVTAFATDAGEGTAQMSYALMTLVGSSGNVGIGVTSPASVLHIKDNSASPTQLSIQSNDFSRAEEINFLNPSTSAISGQIKYYTNPTVEYMSFSTSNNSAAVERMRITSAGNVGIGDASPTNISANTFSLSVNSSRTDLSGAFVNKANGTVKHQQYWDSSGYNFVLNSGNFKFQGGNVGIGTTSPGSKLEVKTSGANTTVELDNSDTNYTLIQYNAQGATKGFSGFNAGFMLFGGESGTTTRLQSGGSYAATILENGNFGIGTTSPAQKLDIVGKMKISDDIILAQTNSRLDYDNGNSNGALRFHSTSGNTERMRITSAGNVGIGTTNATAPLTIAGSGTDGTAMLRLEATAGSQNFNWISSVVYPNLGVGKTAIKLFGQAQGSNNQAYIGFKYAGSGSVNNTLTFGFYANNFLVNLLANGNVGIGTTSPTYKLHVVSSNNVSIFEDTSNASGAAFIVFNRPGVFSMGSITRNGSANSVSYNTGSDYRLKEDLKDFNALDLVNNITAYDYKWKDVDQRDYGFIAHELKQTLPNVVTGEKDGEKMQGVDYSKLTPVLLKAIQEQQKIIDDLKSRIEQLEN